MGALGGLLQAPGSHLFVLIYAWKEKREKVAESYIVDL